MKASVSHKPRVLHIITTFSIGGATENTLFSVRGLRARGYDAWILAGPPHSAEGHLLDMARSMGVRVEILPQLVRNIHPWKDITALLSLVRFLRKEHVDIVHTHSSKAGVLGRLAAFLARTPIIVHTIHGLPFHKYQGKLAFIAFRWAEKLGAQLSHSLIVVTNTIARQLVESGIGRASQVTTVRSGFDTGEYFRARKKSVILKRKYGLKKSDLVVGKISRFSPLKGHHYLLEAIPSVVQKVPNVKFLFIGGGELERDLRGLAKSRGIENNIIFGGVVPPDRIPEAIAAMDVIVHTSLVEGLARVLPQALAAERPIISFDIDGAREVVHHGKTGYLVPPKDIEKLSASIVEILRDKQRATRYGKYGRKLVEKEWTVDAMVDGIEKVYLQHLKPK